MYLCNSFQDSSIDGRWKTAALMDGGEANWSESVEDLVHGGDIDKAISLLESIVSNLQTQEILPQSDHLKLSTALFDLAKLYSTKGFSLKADESQSRALLIQQQSDHSFSPQYDVNIVNELEEVRVSPIEVSACNGSTEEDGRVSSKIFGDGLPSGCCSDDDWEAVADRAPDELLSTQCLPGVSNLSLEDTKIQTPKRRGRGTFSYRKQGLYSDQQSDEPAIDNLEDEVGSHNSRDAEIRDSKYGTRHVLILADFPPSTKTTDLEKLLGDFKDRGVVIRWVNDTVALAVFRTPSIALEACNSLKCPFTVRVLDESDVLLSSIPPRDLEPPRQRPETSARTANRLIANVMGLKLPASSFGPKELRKQEEARRNRIVSRQNMRDDAWGE